MAAIYGKAGDRLVSEQYQTTVVPETATRGRSVHIAAGSQSSMRSNISTFGQSRYVVYNYAAQQQGMRDALTIIAA